MHGQAMMKFVRYLRLQYQLFRMGRQMVIQGYPINLLRG